MALRCNASPQFEPTANRVDHRKSLGAYYTPDYVVRSLVSWAVAAPTDVMLDPSCGDGRFLLAHRNSVGVEHDELAAAELQRGYPDARVHVGDFFSWACSTEDRFTCAAGNPPFIRYQRFAGEIRSRALELCARHGARFSGLTSSWAPFLVATAALLRPDGRMAFVVPAEIGHAPYAQPLLQFLLDQFARVQIVAVREKLFPDLAEDCWLLYADGYGSRTDSIHVTALDSFPFSPAPPKATEGGTVSRADLVQWNWRLRPFLIPAEARREYARLAQQTKRLGDLAKVGIGYVTGANDFFHLRPSLAKAMRIPEQHLRPAVRNGKALAPRVISEDLVSTWLRRDEPVLLLHLRKTDRIGQHLASYLDSPEARRAKESYKCRSREPWYCVPDVVVPYAFLSYMCTATPRLVQNRAGCVGTNSVHVVTLRPKVSGAALLRNWRTPLTELSCEIEGHPLGGGMLKLEPREAARVLVGRGTESDSEQEILRHAAQVLRKWRHCGD